MEVFNNIVKQMGVFIYIHTRSRSKVWGQGLFFYFLKK